MKWIRWDLTSRMKLIASSAAPTKKWLNPTFFSLWIPSVFIYGEKRVSLKRKPPKSEEGDRINQHSIFNFKSGRVDVSWGFDRCNWVWSLLYSFVNQLSCLVLFMLGAGLDAAPPLLVSPLCGVCDTKIKSSHFQYNNGIIEHFQYNNLDRFTKQQKKTGLSSWIYLWHYEGILLFDSPRLSQRSVGPSIHSTTSQPKMKKKNENDGIGCPNKAILKQKPL